MWVGDKQIQDRDRAFKAEGRRLRRERARARTLNRRTRQRKRATERLLGSLDVVTAYFVGEPGTKTHLLLRGVRGSQAMIRWRDRVLRRADHRCRCGATKNLHVDHIEPLSELVKRRGHRSIVDALADRELFRSRNGQLLCFDCHHRKTLKDATRYGWSTAWVGRVFEHAQ